MANICTPDDPDSVRPYRLVQQAAEFYYKLYGRFIPPPPSAVPTLRLKFAAPESETVALRNLLFFVSRQDANPNRAPDAPTRACNIWCKHARDLNRLFRDSVLRIQAGKKAPSPTEAVVTWMTAEQATTLMTMLKDLGSTASGWIDPATVPPPMTSPHTPAMPMSPLFDNVPPSPYDAFGPMMPGTPSTPRSARSSREYALRDANAQAMVQEQIRLAAEEQARMEAVRISEENARRQHEEEALRRAQQQAMEAQAVEEERRRLEAEELQREERMRHETEMRERMQEELDLQEEVQARMARKQRQRQRDEFLPRPDVYVSRPRSALSDRSPTPRHHRPRSRSRTRVHNTPSSWLDEDPRPDPRTGRGYTNEIDFLRDRLRHIVQEHERESRTRHGVYDRPSSRRERRRDPMEDDDDLQARAARLLELERRRQPSRAGETNLQAIREQLLRLREEEAQRTYGTSIYDLDRGLGLGELDLNRERTRRPRPGFDERRSYAPEPEVRFERGPGREHDGYDWDGEIRRDEGHGRAAGGREVRVDNSSWDKPLPSAFD